MRACADVSAQALFGRGPIPCAATDLECDSGGSVRVILGGTLILSRCGFHDNLVDGNVNLWHSNGGALTIDQGHANISDCTFVNNSAAACGAIDLISSTFHVTSSRFIDNHARTQTGGLNTSPSYASTIPSRGVVEYSDFIVRRELAHAAWSHFACGR